MAESMRAAVERTGQRFRLGACRPAVQDDARTLTVQVAHDGAADTPGGAGHEDHPIMQGRQAVKESWAESRMAGR